MSDITAVVFYDSGWLRRVAGLTLLERATMALSRAGISKTFLVVTKEEGREAERPLARLSCAPERIFSGGPTRADRWAAAAARTGAQAALVLQNPVALDPGFVTSAMALMSEPAAGAADAAGGAVLLRPQGLSEKPAAPGTPVDPSAFKGTLVPVANGADGRRARRTLLAQSIKPLDIDGVVCYLLIRRISVRLSALMLPLPITPNMVTALSILLGLAAAVAVGVGSSPWPIVGGSLLMLSLIFDNCDGEIARVKYSGSQWGAWFDIYGDFVVNAAFMTGMAVGAYRTFEQPVYLYAGAFAVLAFSFYNGTVFRYIHRLGIPDEFLFKWWFDQEADAAGANSDRPVSGPTADPGGPSALGRFLSGLKYLGRRDFFIFAYLMTAIFGVLHWAFWATVAGAAMNFVMTCYQVFIWEGIPDDGG